MSATHEQQVEAGLMVLAYLRTSPALDACREVSGFLDHMAKLCDECAKKCPSSPGHARNAAAYRAVIADLRAADAEPCEACASTDAVADRLDPAWTRETMLLCAPCADAAAEAQAERIEA